MIELQLTEQELTQIGQMIDLAVKSQGMAVAGIALQLINKLQQALTTSKTDDQPQAQA